jgi:predicted enzyme related to lactoylglutathione lyase
VTDVFREGGVSYLRIPAPEPPVLAAFYGTVFGWNIRGNPDEPSFDDGSGHVIGHFVRELAPAGADGFRPYVYVSDVDGTLNRALANGAEIETQPYPEGNLRVAVIRDPAGNVVGVWQRS